ncbi:hypothetical protein TRIATDRAFT_259379 [Trichoderma atroviride IMI 206040]|uniref:Uncharacterized protein n=1 Tax=Hypocrea atroviridis (strain ATCC 20476 / IMI 206040) TaxID=452589 RepID=G9P798_HYPAI|nr:uncharacterized protein TRIATDRAFT_259379 [Trichoderma atroviride IMI 206040]EHK41545.1 hypothetical protein TRIATDRAFT_259379 [Trichoderma atroviride IMI 206040]
MIRRTRYSEARAIVKLDSGACGAFQSGSHLIGHAYNSSPTPAALLSDMSPAADVP